jgi:catechol 2,3-dioxygenase-like lactoylglutathione lyase family enzyme
MLLLKRLSVLLCIFDANAFILNLNQNRRSVPASSLLIPIALSSDNVEDDSDSSNQVSTHRLSHMMLRVPSVDRTVAYWTERMGTVLVSRKTEEGSLQSAFVALGNGTSTDHCFALELVQTTASRSSSTGITSTASSQQQPDSFQLGTCLSYIGVSMLLQFQNNLRGAASGQTPDPQGDEPNGIPVLSSASAPGDFLCRLALRTNNLVATLKFYSELLHMTVMAVDDNVLCLRYTNHKGASKTGGVSTTLIFEATADPIVPGTCLDHLAIRTTNPIEEEYRKFQDAGSPITMTPTTMFGSTVMGVRDPNGYKIVVVGE